MKIELNMPHGEVPEHIVDYVKNKLLEFHHYEGGISDTEVNFKKRADRAADKFICEIIVRIFGDTLLLQRSADSYSTAAREVINELKIKVDELTAQLKEPPDEITSTVKL